MTRDELIKYTIWLAKENYADKTPAYLAKKYLVSDWERRLEGRNIHSVLTWCKDCLVQGINMPFEDECGNCGSKNTVRYYDNETINLLF